MAEHGPTQTLSFEKESLCISKENKGLDIKDLWEAQAWKSLFFLEKENPREKKDNIELVLEREREFKSPSQRL